MKNTVWANALLSDGEILFWYTGDECESPGDFYKDFYYAGIRMSEYEKIHTLTVAKQKFAQLTDNDNHEIFNVLAPNFYRKFKISKDHKGRKPY